MIKSNKLRWPGVIEKIEVVGSIKLLMGRAG